MLGVAALAADTAEQATWLSGSTKLAVLRLRQGRPGRYPTPGGGGRLPVHARTSARRSSSSRPPTSSAIPRPSAPGWRSSSNGPAADELMVTTMVARARRTASGPTSSSRTHAVSSPRREDRWQSTGFSSGCPQRNVHRVAAWRNPSPARPFPRGRDPQRWRSDQLDRQIARLFVLVGDGLAAATAAFLAGDKLAASEIASADVVIDELRHDAEIADRGCSCGRWSRRPTPASSADS